MTTKNYLGALALVKKDGDTLHIADLGQVTEGLITDVSLAETLADYTTTESLTETLADYVANTGTSATVGSGTNPVYVSSGTVAASTSTAGGTAKPVYLSSGTITACSSTVGSGTKPVYMSSGTITASSSTVGSGTKPIYLSSGTLTVSSSTVGDSDTPVYLKAGVLTACSTSMSESAYPTVEIVTNDDQYVYVPSGGTWLCFGQYSYGETGGGESSKSGSVVYGPKLVSGGTKIVSLASSYDFDSCSIACIRTA